MQCMLEAKRLSGGGGGCVVGGVVFVCGGSG